jgi:peptidylprolyl isomerase
MPKITDTVYLDISVDEEPLGRIVVGLFGEVVPRTAENFKRLCACDAGKGKYSGVDLCYKGTPIHRISKCV